MLCVRAESSSVAECWASQRALVLHLNVDFVHCARFGLGRACEKLESLVGRAFLPIFSNTSS